MANPHVSTHMTTEHDNNHAAIPMRSATTDSKTPSNCANTHTDASKAAWSHRYTTAKQTSERPEPHPPHTRAAVHRRLQPLHTEKRNSRFRAPASSPKLSPCKMHAAITMRFVASRSKPACIYAHGSKTWQQSCAITLRSATMQRFNKRMELRTLTHNRSLQNIEEEPIWPRNGPSRTRRTHEVYHRRLQPLYTEKRNSRFVLPFPPQNKAHATVMQPLQCVLQPSITWPQSMTTITQPLHWKIQQAQITTHTWTTTRCRTQTRNQFDLCVSHPRFQNTM